MDEPVSGLTNAVALAFATLVSKLDSCRLVSKTEFTTALRHLVQETRDAAPGVERFDMQVIEVIANQIEGMPHSPSEEDRVVSNSSRRLPNAP